MNVRRGRNSTRCCCSLQRERTVSPQPAYNIPVVGWPMVASKENPLCAFCTCLRMAVHIFNYSNRRLCVSRKSKSSFSLQARIEVTGLQRIVTLWDQPIAVGSSRWMRIKVNPNYKMCTVLTWFHTWAQSCTLGCEIAVAIDGCKYICVPCVRVTWGCLCHCILCVVD